MKLPVVIIEFCNAAHEQESYLMHHCLALAMSRRSVLRVRCGARFGFRWGLHMRCAGHMTANGAKPAMRQSLFILRVHDRESGAHALPAKDYVAPDAIGPTRLPAGL